MFFLALAKVPALLFLFLMDIDYADSLKWIYNNYGSIVEQQHVHDPN